MKNKRKILDKEKRKKTLTCSNDNEAHLVRLSPPFVTSRVTLEHFEHVHRG